MRKYLALIIASCLAQAGLAQQFAQDSTWILNNYTKKEFQIPMRDGKKLFTSVYLPKDATEKHPILFTRTPYTVAPYGTAFSPRLWMLDYRYFARENYIIVFQDVRGRWMSEGEFVDVRPFNANKKTNDEIDEASDTYDAIDWMVKNLPDNNGNVGVFGTSYPGFYSTMAGLSGHPALKAVSPQAPVTDWFQGDDFHHNGAFCLMDAFAFYVTAGFGHPRPQPTTARPNVTLKLPKNDNYETYLRIGALKNFLALTGDSIQFWKDMFAHPNRDAFWEARDARNSLQHFPANTASLVVGGTYDAEDCFGAWRTYEAIEKKAKNNNKVVMGPWYHGQWMMQDGDHLGHVRFGDNTSHYYQNQIEIPFFNYYLKGKGDISHIPEASVYFTGANEWKNLPQWPVAEKKDQPIYLQESGLLSWSKPTAKASFSEYVSDPKTPVPYTEDIHYTRTRDYMTDDQRFAAHRSDVLTFQTPVLENDLTLGGTVIADLLASITTTDADFVVKVIDVFPDDFKYPGFVDNTSRTAGTGDYPMGGYQMLVRGEIMRGRFRNSFATPEAFKPNKVERVKFELPDIAHTFKKGHRLMIQIQSSWFPLFDRNPQQFVDIYKCSDADFKKANIKIHHDAANSSSIILPVIP
ncbi:CocE/NonD family hydrolase [Pseudoflavitalea sp. G-6-1-2]|uniref:CocE/NonD family hydrolase n=1 Tax=Pseudoflavitalea sp. G-6-1-2 TaxID=2728841 RepID=UPI00146F6C8D|nr:CocE/NonD family hydrolase [Pseudoflavitalea sp. G-6-1-2]NML22174.1 CocE/NonD family hydrolase [Pseudoflavitalea sp. G-6-1-2]